MHLLSLAKKVSSENPEGVWGITAGVDRSLAYLRDCYMRYDYLQCIGHSNPSPDLIEVCLASNIYCDDIEFLGYFAEELFESPAESEIQGLIAKVYWCLLNSGADELWGLLCTFYSSVGPADVSR